MEDYYFDKIARDYHYKRRKPWKPLKFYLNHLKKSGYRFTGYSIDLGCANGRHFKLFKNKNSKLIGIDLSLRFLRIAKENLEDTEEYKKNERNGIDLILADLNNLPIREESINNLFSIATIHHVESKAQRKKALNDLYDILKPKGYLILTVWRKWQRKYTGDFIIDFLKRIFKPFYQKRQEEQGLVEFGDKHIPWTLSQEKMTYNRFYHFFSKRELRRILDRYTMKELLIRGGPTDKDNFFVFAQK